jgi:hypothetical protein
MRIIIETDAMPTIQTVGSTAQAEMAGEIPAIDAGAAPVAAVMASKGERGRESPLSSDPASPIDAGAPTFEFIETMQGIDPADRYRLWESLNPDFGPDAAPSQW